MSSSLAEQLGELYVKEESSGGTKRKGVAPKEEDEEGDVVGLPTSFVKRKNKLPVGGGNLTNVISSNHKKASALDNEAAAAVGEGRRSMEGGAGSSFSLSRSSFLRNQQEVLPSGGSISTHSPLLLDGRAKGSIAGVERLGEGGVKKQKRSSTSLGFEPKAKGGVFLNTDTHHSREEEEVDDRTAKWRHRAKEINNRKGGNHHHNGSNNGNYNMSRTKIMGTTTTSADRQHSYHNFASPTATNTGSSKTAFLDGDESDPVDAQKRTLVDWLRRSTRNPPEVAAASSQNRVKTGEDVLRETLGGGGRVDEVIGGRTITTAAMEEGGDVASGLSLLDAELLFAQLEGLMPREKPNALRLAAMCAIGETISKDNTIGHAVVMSSNPSSSSSGSGLINPSGAPVAKISSSLPLLPDVLSRRSNIISSLQQQDAVGASSSCRSGVTATPTSAAVVVTTGSSSRSRSTTAAAAGRHAIQTLIKEFVEATYLPRGGEGMPTEEYMAERLTSIGVSSPVNAALQRYLCRKPYFEAFRELTDRGAELEGKVTNLQGCIAKQAKVIDFSVDNWQQQIKGFAFRAWRGAVVRSRSQGFSVNTFVKRFQRRDRLQTHFYAWRAVVHVAVSNRVQKQYSDGVEQLVTMEAVSSSRNVEIEDSLRELQLVVIRLKEEKSQYDDIRTTLTKNMEVSLLQAEEWRTVSIDALNFLGSIRQNSTIVKDVGGEDFQLCGQLAVTVVLGWVHSVIKQLPKSEKVRCNNFGPDLRDGKVFIMLLHVVTDGDIELNNVSHKESRKRMEIVRDCLRNLKLHLPISEDDLVAGNSDLNFILLFCIWWHYSLPPTPSEDVCVHSQGFRDDLKASAEYLEECRTYYPRWLEHRTTLHQYATYLLICRSRGTPAKVLSTQEEKEIARDMTLFSIKDASPNTLPTVFLNSIMMSGMQRTMNEDERDRINATIRNHVELLRTTFSFYSTQLHTRQQKPGKGKKGKGPTKSKKVVSVDAVMYGVVDFTGFYRLLEDCKLIVASGVTEPGDVDADGGEGKALEGLTKPQCYQFFLEICKRFLAKDAAAAAATSSGTGSPTPVVTQSTKAKSQQPRGLTTDSYLLPDEWVCALTEIAVMRHGLPILPSSQQPAPGAIALDTLINKDIAPFACVSQGSAFKQEAWSEEVQSELEKHRGVLMGLFELYAGLDGDGTMSYEEMMLLVRDCDVLAHSSHYSFEHSAVFSPITDGQTTQVAGGSLRPRERVGEEGMRAEQRLLIAQLGSPNPVTDAVLSQLFRQFDATANVITATNGTQQPQQPSTTGQPPTVGRRGSMSLLQTPSTNALKASASVTPGTNILMASSPTNVLVYGEFEMALISLSVFIYPAPFVPLYLKVRRIVEPLADKAVHVLKKAAKKRQQEAEAELKAQREKERQRQLQEEAERRKQEEHLERQRQQHEFATRMKRGEL